MPVLSTFLELLFVCIKKKAENTTCRTFMRSIQEMKL